MLQDPVKASVEATTTLLLINDHDRTGMKNFHVVYLNYLPRFLVAQQLYRLICLFICLSV